MVENTELKISVVIPMYNASQSIVKALDSVKYQTYKCTYQILVVNDGSEDCSKETVEKYINAGVGRIILGTKAATDRDFLKKMTDKFGEKIAVGIDAKEERVNL